MAKCDGWTETTLDELVLSGVILLGRGNVISKKDMEADPGPFPVYSSAQNNDGRIGTYNQFMFDEELITWSVDGGGYVFYRKHHKFSVTNIGGYLRILDKSKFLYPFLAVVLQQLHGEHIFDWQNKAHPSVIRKLYNNIPLPPLAEQRRIVDVVSSVDAYIDALQQKVDAARTARNALEVSEFDNPENEISLLGDHCDRFDIQVGPFGTQLHRHDYVADGIPVVMPKDIIDGRISEANIARITTQKAEELKKHILKSGDVLFARRGDLSKRALVSDTEAGWLCGTGTVRVRSSHLGGALLFRLTNTSGVNAWLMDNSVGMTMPNLNTSIISAIPLRVPENPLEAISLLKTIDEFIQTLNVSLIRVKSLRSGLLSDLLSGEHEIPVSYDELLGAA